MNVSHEVNLLVEEIQRLGSKRANTLSDEIPDYGHNFFELLLRSPKEKNKFSEFVTDAEGQTSVKFGVLFNDDRCANIFEALVGTLRAAKRKKIVAFDGELLLQGVHDNVDIILLQK